MEAGGDEDDHLHHEEAGADEAGDEVEEGVEAASLVTDRARTRDLGAGRHGGACRDLHTVGRRQEHRRAAEEVEVEVEAAAMGEETPHPEEAKEAVVAGEAQVTTRTTVHDRGAGAGVEDRKNRRLA